jgi:hypothetical protein
LHHAEDVSLGVFAVRKPTHTLNRHLGQRKSGAGRKGCRNRFVNRLNTYGADIGIDSLSPGGRGPAAEQDSAVDARLVFGAGRDQPIPVLQRRFNVRGYPFLDVPTEHVTIELCRPLRIGGVDLEMNDSIHWFSP